MNAPMNARNPIRILSTLKNWWWRISEGEVCSPV